MHNNVDAGAVFDYVVVRIRNSSYNARDLSDINLPKRKAEFCELLSGKTLSKHILYDIALHWLDGDCNENLTLIHHCMTNADGPSASKILSHACDGHIDEQTAKDIASALCVVSEFVDRDYEDNLEAYEGLLPIWGDDWDYITELLLEKASQGMSGEDILSAMQRWVDQGAYNHCYIEDALEPFLPVGERMQTCADFLILHEFAELEGDPDWLYSNPDWRIRADAFLNSFTEQQTEVLQQAAAWVAAEVRNGLHCEKVGCYEVIKNSGPYPLDITKLMDVLLSAQDMQVLWAQMVDEYMAEVYGHTKDTHADCLENTLVGAQERARQDIKGRKKENEIVFDC